MVVENVYGSEAGQKLRRLAGVGGHCFYITIIIILQ